MKSKEAYKNRKLHPDYPHAYYGTITKGVDNDEFFQDRFAAGETILYVVAEDFQGGYNVLFMDVQQKKCNAISFKDFESHIAAHALGFIRDSGPRVMKEQMALYMKKITIGHAKRNGIAAGEDIE